MKRAALLALLLAGAACRRPPELDRYTAFVPVTIRSNNPGRPRWATRTSLTNTSPISSRIRLTRWPPETPDEETRDFDLSSGQTVSVPGAIPLGTPSAFFFEGKAPFAVTVSIVDRRGLAPSVRVPVLNAEDLAKPGDRLVMGPILDTPETRGHFCFTWPGIERDAVPFRVRVRLLPVGGGAALRDETFVLAGLPVLVDDPWKRFGLPAGTAFDVETTFLGSARTRPVAAGMWIYGVSTERATGASHFLETRVVRATAR